MRKDVGDYFVVTFDCVLANWMGAPPALCRAAETCGHAGVVEYNGDLYSCDHYVFPEYKPGNINELVNNRAVSNVRKWAASQPKHK